MNNQKVWFVTGASKGMGLLLTKLLLAKGNKVAATSRNADSLRSTVGIEGDHFLPLELDITNSEDVSWAINQTVRYFGRLDVAVNNAGFSFIGSLEELTDEEFRKALDVNLFGTVNVIRASMAQFRKQRSGRVINIASAAGYIAGPNIGSYVASKFAVVGLTEALALAAHLNVKPTVILPGSFRTNFLDEGSLNYAKSPIAEYESANTYKSYAERAGKQPGDPQKLVTELINLADMENPPVHLILGPDSLKMIMEKRTRDLEEFEAFKKISLSTDSEFAENVELQGWTMLIHPDFIRGYTLAAKITKFGFFSYAVNEALHLSDKEATIVEEVMDTIRKEYSARIDAYSQDILISQIELLLNYCNRFYNRQFITRKTANSELLINFEKLINDYFEGGNLSSKGIPSVQYFSNELNMSANYLSDILRSLTGQSTQQHIHDKLIEKAKHILTSTNMTVSEIAYELGFEYPQSFSKLFKNKTSFTPMEFRQSFN